MSNEIAGFANASDVDAQNALNALSTGLVKVLHASADGVFPLAGYTVASARATFASSYNIAEGAIAMIGGNPVGEDYILSANETLEFIQQAGEKG